MASVVLVSKYLLESVPIMLHQALALRCLNKPTPFRLLLWSSVVIRVLFLALEPFSTIFGVAEALLLAVLLYVFYRLLYRHTLTDSFLLSLSQVLLVICLEYIFLLAAPFTRYHTPFKLFTLHLSATAVLILLVLLPRELCRVLRKRPWFAPLLFFPLFLLPCLVALRCNQINSSACGILCVFLLIPFVCCSLHYLYSASRLTSIANRLEEERLRLERAEERNRKLQIFKHEYGNTIHTLGGLIDAGDCEGLVRFRQELDAELVSAVNEENVRNGLADNPLLRGLVLSKLSQAQQEGVAFRVSIPCEIRLWYCSSVDFTRMIGILLDNALEAAARSSRKTMSMTVLPRGRCCYLIRIENSCAPDALPDLSRCFLPGCTTKENHAGLGLSAVSGTVQKYRRQDCDMSIAATCADGLVTMTLRI